MENQGITLWFFCRLLGMNLVPSSVINLCLCSVRVSLLLLLQGNLEMNPLINTNTRPKKTKAMELPINSIRFIQAGPSRFIPSSFAALFPSSSSDSYESIESQGSTCRFFACHLRHNQAKLPVYQIC